MTKISQLQRCDSPLIIQVHQEVLRLKIPVSQVPVVANLNSLYAIYEDLFHHFFCQMLMTHVYILTEVQMHAFSYEIKAVVTGKKVDKSDCLIALA